MEKEQGDLRTPSRRHVCRIDAKHSAAAPCKRGRGGLQIRTKNTYSANTFAFGGFNTNCKLSRYMPLKIARLSAVLFRKKIRGPKQLSRV